VWQKKGGGGRYLQTNKENLQWVDVHKGEKRGGGGRKIFQDSKKPSNVCNIVHFGEEHKPEKMVYKKKSRGKKGGNGEKKCSNNKCSQVSGDQMLNRKGAGEGSRGSMGKQSVLKEVNKGKNKRGKQELTK